MGTVELAVDVKLEISDVGQAMCTEKRIEREGNVGTAEKAGFALDQRQRRLEKGRRWPEIVSRPGGMPVCPGVSLALVER